MVGDAEQLSDCFVVNNGFKLIIADPPYTPEDAKKYGYKMPNRKKVLSECYKVVCPGGYLVWLDTRVPMWRKKEWKMVGTIGIVRSSNHRVRMVFIFKRV